MKCYNVTFIFQIKASLIKRDNGRSIESEKKDVEENSFSYDVWSTENKNTDFTNLSKWLTSDTIRHNSQNTGKFKKQIPKSVHSKTSLLPAVEVPHPGLSYNPSLKDHTHILQKVAEKEVALIKEENHLNRVTTKMFSQIPKGQLEKEWISEMTVGLTATNSGTDEDDGEEYKAVNPPVRNRKKSLQKKRKKREALELKEKLKREKIEKKKLSDIYKVRIFNESLNKRDERILKNMEKRNKVKKQKPFTTRHLGQIKYEEPEIDFQLPEELSGNLRNIKAETNLLFDRFKSLQKRNILPPTVKRHVKKAKRKEYERDHTKLDWELENRESLSRKPKK